VGDDAWTGRRDYRGGLPRKATRRARNQAGGAKGSRSTTVTRDRTSEFFAELGRRGQEPLLEKVTGRARFDIGNRRRTEHWYVAIDKGAISVSRRKAPADAVVHASRETFDHLAGGERNIMAATLRGEVVIGGDPRFLVRLQRLFPRPASGR
jgi:SCP-2 sterol transfer family